MKPFKKFSLLKETESVTSYNTTMAKEKLYYIQNGYVGNAMCWWAKDSRGYTCDINKAGRYTHEEAKQIIKRPEDIAWLCSHVDNNSLAHKMTIDAQYLNHRYCLKGKRK